MYLTGSAAGRARILGARAKVGAASWRGEPPLVRGESEKKKRGVSAPRQKNRRVQGGRFFAVVFVRGRSVDVEKIFLEKLGGGLGRKCLCEKQRGKKKGGGGGVLGGGTFFSVEQRAPNRGEKSP